MALNRLKSMTAYLSGPIDDDPDRGVAWRDEITPFLTGMNVNVINPLKHTFYGIQELNEVKRPLIASLLEQGNIEEVHQEIKQFIRWDLHSVDISTFVIVNYDTNFHMCGTYQELFTAAREHKPVLLVCKKPINKLSMWIYGIVEPQYMFPSWDDLKAYLKRINSDPNYEMTEVDKRKWIFFDGAHMTEGGLQ